MRTLTERADEWARVQRVLGIPRGWTLQPREREGHWVGDSYYPFWTLTATGGPALSCGHRSMQVTASSLPLAVAVMAVRVRFHERYCGR